MRRQIMLPTDAVLQGPVILLKVQVPPDLQNHITHMQGTGTALFRPLCCTNPSWEEIGKTRADLA